MVGDGGVHIILSAFMGNSTMKVLTLGKQYDPETRTWIGKCNVEGDLSSLKNMTQLEVLNLKGCEKVTGDLADLEGSTGLRVLRVRLGEERSDKLTTLTQAAKTARAQILVQGAPHL